MGIFKKLLTPRRAWYKARIAELEQRLAAPTDLEVTQEYWDKLAEHIYYNHILCLGKPRSLSEENETCQHAYRSVALSVLDFLKNNPPDLGDDGNWLRLAIQHNGDAFLDRLLEDDPLDGALVPVPDGEPVSLYECQETYIQYNGWVYQACEDGEWYTVIGKPHTRLHTNDDDTLVQPVRLVRVRDMEGRNDG